MIEFFPAFPKYTPINEVTDLLQDITYLFNVAVLWILLERSTFLQSNN